MAGTLTKEITMMRSNFHNCLFYVWDC